MKKAEIIIGIVALLAIIMNLLLFVGATILIVLSLSLLSCFYMYLSFALFNGVQLSNITNKESYTGIGAPRIIGAIGAGLALSLTVIGILFKFQSYPGATFNLSVGLISLAVVTIVGLVKYFKTKSAFYTGIFKRVAIFGLFGLTLLYTPRTTIIDFKYRNHPAYLNALKQAMANPDNKEMGEKADEEREILYSGDDSTTIRKYYQSKRNRQK
jgi:hypothetical protein